MNLTDFLPYVLPKTKGCPEPVALLETRLAIIELCAKALIWREYQSAVTTVLGQTGYDYAPASGQQVSRLLSAKLNGSDIEVVLADIGKLYDGVGRVTPYVYGTFSGFELRPAQEADLPVVTYAAVAPSLSADDVPDAFGRYVEQIAHGALSRIMAVKDKAYSDPNGASAAYSQWQDDIGSAKSEALLGFARGAARTTSAWF